MDHSNSERISIASKIFAEKWRFVASRSNTKKYAARFILIWFLLMHAPVYYSTNMTRIQLNITKQKSDQDQVMGEATCFTFYMDEHMYVYSQWDLLLPSYMPSCPLVTKLVFSERWFIIFSNLLSRFNLLCVLQKDWEWKLDSGQHRRKH